MVTVAGHNRAGEGPRSRPSFVYVGYSVPKSSVAGLRATATSSTEVTLSWQKWPQDAEPIAGFKIR